MDSVARPEDALAQPTRVRLLELICENGRPSSTDELANLTGLHPNGVRSHLERLVQAGLVIKTVSSAGRGRPRHLWSEATGARAALNQPRAYEQLATWLSSAIDTSPQRLREVEAAGRQIGREQARASDRQSGFDGVEAAVASLGFQPRVDYGPGDRMVICLSNCPYRDAVRQNPKVICNLHHGMTLGLLDELDPGTVLTGFVPKDPDRAGCLIELTSAKG